MRRDVADRIELRNQDVQRLDERDRYTLAWLAGPFIPLETVDAALDRIEGRPYAVIVAAGTDGSGAARQIERIATGWRLKEVAPALIVRNGAQTPEAILARVQLERQLRLPMRPGNRSLNLSNAVAVVVYEAWRQNGFAQAMVPSA